MPQRHLAAFAGLVAEGDGLLHAGAIHVVEQDDVDAVDLEHFAELVKRVDLDLDEARDFLGTAAGDDRREVRGQIAQGLAGDVVVLDQQAVVEADAVVEPPAAADGVLVERRGGRASSCACRRCGRRSPRRGGQTYA